MTFRPFIKKFFWFVIASLIIVILLFYRWYLIDFSIPNLYQFLAASLFPIGLIVRAFLWVYPAIYSKYEIFDNRMLRTFHGKKEDYLFDDIRSIHFSLISARFSGGYVLYFKNGRKLRVPSFLINSDFLLEKVQATKPEMLSKKLLNKYRENYQNIDASWARTKKKLRSPYRLLAHFLVIPLGFSYFATANHLLESLSLDQQTSFMIHIFIAHIMLFASNSLEEFIIQKLERTFEKSPVFYKAVDYFSSGLYYMLCFVYLILTKSLPITFL